MKKQTMIILAICLSGALAHSAQETLPETVRRVGGNIENHITREFSPADLSELVKTAEVAVRGLVVDGPRPYLAADGRTIESDYTVQVLDRIFARQSPPGQTIVVTKPGGTMMFGGYKVTSTESQFPEFTAGEEYVLLLKRDPKTGKYFVPYGAQGAFRNVNGLVEQVQEGDWNREHGKIPATDFMQQVAGVARSQ